jgi:hypothetical protein
MNALEHLAAAKKTLAEERDEIVRLLGVAETCAAAAVHAFEQGRHAAAKAALEKGCDAEFEALCNCDALGGLSQALYPEPEDEVP